MVEKINSKIQKKINYILELQAEIRNWQEKAEEEVEKLLQKFEKTPRDEVSMYFNPYFRDNKFAKTLVQIAESYAENLKIQRNVIAALGHMIHRYHLEETKEIYAFFKKNSEKKSISAYVAIHLPYLKGFEEEEKPWEYFMSMRKMVPKKIAQGQFVSVISKYIHEIPREYRDDVIAFLKEKKEGANHEGGKKYYQELIEEIEK